MYGPGFNAPAPWVFPNPRIDFFSIPSDRLVGLPPGPVVANGSALPIRTLSGPGLQPAKCAALDSRCVLEEVAGVA